MPTIRATGYVAEIIGNIRSLSHRCENLKNLKSRSLCLCWNMKKPYIRARMERDKNGGAAFCNTIRAGVVQNLDNSKQLHRRPKFGPRPADRPLHRCRTVRQRYQCDKLSHRWGSLKRPHPRAKGGWRNVTPFAGIANCEGQNGGGKSPPPCRIDGSKEVATICRNSDRGQGMSQTHTFLASVSSSRTPFWCLP